jgi:hypothetical protein
MMNTHRSAIPIRLNHSLPRIRLTRPKRLPPLKTVRETPIYGEVIACDDNNWDKKEAQKSQSNTLEHKIEDE